MQSRTRPGRTPLRQPVLRRGSDSVVSKISAPNIWRPCRSVSGSLVVSTGSLIPHSWSPTLLTAERSGMPGVANASSPDVSGRGDRTLEQKTPPGTCPSKPQQSEGRVGVQRGLHRHHTQLYMYSRWCHMHLHNFSAVSISNGCLCLHTRGHRFGLNAPAHSQSGAENQRAVYSPRKLKMQAGSVRQAPYVLCTGTPRIK